MDNHEPTHLDLFSGIGGFAKAAREAGFRTIGFCEIDSWCPKVLKKNFMANAKLGRQGFTKGQQHGAGRNSRGQSESFSGVPIHSDIFALDGTTYRGVILITGGFPCQPFSIAGKQRGAADDRALWPEMFRVITQARPAWVLGENVPGLIPMELDNVLYDLESIGYATRSFVIPACAVDARHRRDRLWIIGRREFARASDGRSGRTYGCESQRSREICRANSILRDTTEQRLQNRRSAPMGNTGGTEPEPERPDSGDWCRWLPEPDVGRVAHGIPSRVDRLKGLGNAIVPQVAYEILHEIRKLI